MNGITSSFFLDQYYTDQDKYMFGYPIPMEPIEISNEDGQGLFAKAMELFKKSTDAVNADKAWWSNLEILQQNKKAIYYLEEEIKQNPSDVKSYILLGKLNTAIFQTGRATDILSKAIEMDPNFSDPSFPPGEALFQRGKAYFCDFNNQKAKENFRAAIDQFDHKEAKEWIEISWNFPKR